MRASSLAGLRLVEWGTASEIERVEHAVGMILGPVAVRNVGLVIDVIDEHVLSVVLVGGPALKCQRYEAERRAPATP